MTFNKEIKKINKKEKKKKKKKKKRKEKKKELKRQDRSNMMGQRLGSSPELRSNNGNNVSFICVLMQFTHTMPLTTQQ